ncbi:hypothetical protein GCM10027168_45100 [Streptomyces capparidis]
MPRNAATVQLRPHQAEAVEAIVKGLDIPPGRRIPREGLRATAVAPCGSGKTYIAAAAAHRLAPRGRVLGPVWNVDQGRGTILVWRVEI